MTLADDERPTPGRSRIHRARHLLVELRRLRAKFDRASALASLPEERNFCLLTADVFDQVLRAGEHVLGAGGTRAGSTADHESHISSRSV